MNAIFAAPFHCFAATGGANIFTYFGNSNSAGKLIVLALFVFSLIAWTIMIGKYMDMKRLSRFNRDIAKQLAGLNAVVDCRGKNPGASPYGGLLKAALDALERFRDRKGEEKATCMGHVENALQRSVAEETIKYESRMVLLGSIVTGAPFLGLLGTVWGVMDAFGGMGGGAASLQNLAPGVSGALLTTVAGLLVAIPSVFGYNYLLTETKKAVTDLENFASSLADRIELEM